MDKLEKLIDKFINASIKYGDAQLKGDSKTVNQQSKIITKVRDELKANPEFGMKKVVPLLNHPNDYVKLKAAFTVISVEPQIAKDVLKQLSGKVGLLAFEAEMILTEWEKGNLGFQWIP